MTRLKCNKITKNSKSLLCVLYFLFYEVAFRAAPFPRISLYIRILILSLYFPIIFYAKCEEILVK